MLITVCRLYDSYPDAHRVIVALEAAGLPPSETSVISNNSYTWYSAAKNANVVPLQKDSGGSKAGKPMARSRGRPSGLRSARQRQPLPASSPCWRFLVSAPSSAPDGFLEGVRRGGTLVAARVPETELPRVEAMMNHSAVNLRERCDLYRKSGWQAFDPNAVPYTADQVRSERALHAQ